MRARLDRRAAAGHVAAWTDAHIAEAERAEFREVAENELLGLHEGNFARDAIRPAEFAAWQAMRGIGPVFYAFGMEGAGFPKPPTPKPPTPG